MSDLIDIDQLDADGAIGEAAAAAGVDRAAFFKRAGIAGAALAGSAGLMGSLPALASAAAKGSLPRSDVAILNYALTLEYLEASFYAEAMTSNALKGHVKSMARLLARHEAEHVETLKTVLGAKAISKPRFDFHGIPHHRGRFVKTAFALENTGVHAYLGQAGNIKTPAILLAAATIVTVEARHSAGIAMLLRSDDPRGNRGISPDGAFDVGFSKQKVLGIVEGLNFIV